MRDDINLILNGKSSYAVVKYDNKVEYIYIHCFREFSEDGSDYYLEYPCQLYQYGEMNLDNKEDLEFAEEYGYTIIDGIAYEIVNWQSGPWLPKKFSIDLVTEEEMIKILIGNGQ